MLIVLLFGLAGCSKDAGKYTPVSAAGGAVKIAKTAVSDGAVHFFTYRSGGGAVKFFIRMDGTGSLHAHFDACLTCYRHKKGYRQEGTDVVCNECGFTFRLADKEWDERGGCRPIVIPHAEDGDFLTISTSDLARGEKLFN